MGNAAILIEAIGGSRTTEFIKDWGRNRPMGGLCTGEQLSVICTGRGHYLWERAVVLGRCYLPLADYMPFTEPHQLTIARRRLEYHNNR